MTNADLPDERERGGTPPVRPARFGHSGGRILRDHWRNGSVGLRVCSGDFRRRFHFEGRSPADPQSSLRKNGIVCLLTWGGDPEDPRPWVVRGDIEGVRFDILPQIAGTRVERGTPLPGLGIRVCGVSDFIALKYIAGGPQDLLDVANLLWVRPDLREEALRIAGDYGISHRLLLFLKPF